MATTNFYGARNNVGAKIPPGGSYTAGAGSITVDDASGFLYTDGSVPSSTKPILVSTFLADGTPKGIYRCEGKTGNTLTLTAFVSGIDADLPAGALVEMRVDAEYHAQITNAINANESAIAVLQTDDATTLHTAAIGTTVQAYDVDLTAIAALTPTKGNAIVGNGTAWVALGVGADGQVITADATQASGLKWAAPAVPAPGGSNTQVQFNDAGALAGNAALTFSKATGILTMSGILLNNAAILGSQFGDYGNAKGYVLTTTAGRNWDFGNRMTTNVQVVIGAIAGQTADQLQLRNSAGVVNFAFDKANRPYSGGNAPTIAAGPGAGTAPTVSIVGTDISGTITITTGTAPTAGAIVATVTFSAAWAAVPKGVTITAVGPNAALVMATSPFYEDQASRSTTVFNVKVAGATALAGSTTYVLGYRVDG